MAVAYCVPAKTPAMGVPLSNVLFVGLSRLDTSKIQVRVKSEGGFEGSS